jgi:hypothetical protein
LQDEFQPNFLAESNEIRRDFAIKKVFESTVLRRLDLPGARTVRTILHGLVFK